MPTRPKWSRVSTHCSKSSSRSCVNHHGHTNKFLGDGALAVFGAPEMIIDHADQAIQAAAEIQRQARAQFGDTLRLGIGVNTGRVIAGTVGGGGKLEYTLIGDPVNVAARVEELTKTTKDIILVTQMTVDALHYPPAGVISRGAHVMRGRTEPINVYALDPLPQTGAVH